MNLKIITVMLLCCIHVMACYADVKIQKKSDSKGENIVLENSLVRIVISPAKGGRLSSYKYKNGTIEWVETKTHGLFMDHVTQQSWPGELMDRKYDYEILSEGPLKAEVKLWTTIEGKGNASISGLRYVKRYTLEKGSAYLKVAVRLENPTKEIKRPGLWIQNIASGGNSSGSHYTYRPTTIGPLEGIYNSSTKFEEKTQFRFDPTAGWIAQMDPPLKQGLVFFMDYNYIKCLYCCMDAQTAEWWFHPTTILSGKSFETQMGLWPISGLSAVTYASDHFIGSLGIKRKGKTVDVKLSYTSGPAALRIKKINVSLVGYPELQEMSSKEIPVDGQINGCMTQSIKVENIDEKTSLLATVKVIFENGTEEKFERFSGGVAILGCETPYHTIRPQQRRPIDKPAKIVKHINSKPRILHFCGLFHESYRWNEIAKCLNAEIINSDYSNTIYGDSLSVFPTSYEELMKYDLIIVNDVPWNVFSYEMLVYMNDFVEHGGLIMIIGGPMNFYDKQNPPKIFMNLLPVVPKSEMITVRLDKPEYLDVRQKAAGVFEYIYTPVSIKPDSKVLIGRKELPMLVYKAKGQGGVLFFTPQILGENGSDRFWISKNYPQWMADRVSELFKNHGLLKTK